MASLTAVKMVMTIWVNPTAVGVIFDRVWLLGRALADVPELCGEMKRPITQLEGASHMEILLVPVIPLSEPMQGDHLRASQRIESKLPLTSMDWNESAANRKDDLLVGAERNTE
ncbi:MAG: hypothetical protein JNN07_27115 [Verrucomicrobiales bacterium]|nr:hypothetical protein [Verrucomicrobiales bacterium]